MDNDFLDDARLLKAAGVEGSKRWSVLSQARQDASKTRQNLHELLKDFSEDSDVVVFGSLARREWTNRSDVDWTLLVDGQVNLGHQEVVLKIRRKLAQAQFPAPGVSGVFGGFTVSHDIVHRIGGEGDTNLNTTRRVLLLLESTSLRRDQSIGAYDRTVRAVLDRYVSDAIRFQHHNLQEFVPRFLLSDIVRYWRTICVDFVSKDWEQGGQKWALRNAKLRISRKVLFAAGMLAVFRFSQDTKGDEKLERSRLVERLQKIFAVPTLDRLVGECLVLDRSDLAVRILGAYDTFLMILNDDQHRNALADLSVEQAGDHSLFNKVRKLSAELQAALVELFFSDTELGKFSREYGVF